MSNLSLVRGPDDPCISLEECIRANCPDCAHPGLRAAGMFSFPDSEPFDKGEMLDDMSEMPPAIAWCVAEGLLASGSEHYRVHRAAHVLAHQLNYLTFVASRFSPATKETPWLVEVEGQVVCPNVVVLRPSVLTSVRYDDDYSDLDPGTAWEEMRQAVKHAQRHGQIVLLDLDDHPYAWNEYHPEARITPEQWEAHDTYVAQFNAVLCSTKYLQMAMDERFVDDFLNVTQKFEYAPNLYDPWRYHPERARFGKVLGSHIFVKARDQGDFDVLGNALRPVFASDRQLSFLHIGEEFACLQCTHPQHHHYLGQHECDDCMCEVYVPVGHSTLAEVANLPTGRIIMEPACNPSELQDRLTYNVGVVPLADSVWNWAKTEGKGFEMAAAGIPFVALTGEHPLYIRLRSSPINDAIFGWSGTEATIRAWTTSEEAWKASSVSVRKWAEQIAKEHQIEFVATWKRLANSNLSK